MRSSIVLPEELQKRVVPQEDVTFTSEDRVIWSNWVRGAGGSLERVDYRYLEGLEAMAFDPLRIPTLEDLDDRLAEVGWTAMYVDGYLNSRSYAWMISNGVFPVARSIRSASHLAHSPAPDMIHDLMGHLPLLFCEDIRTYMNRWAEVMLEVEESPLDSEFYRANRDMSLLMSDPACSSEAIQNAQSRTRMAQEAIAKRPTNLAYLNRIFLWSIEFGLIGDASHYSIVGSGLLSAPKEREHLLRGGARILDYTLDAIRHDIEFSSLQNCYFVSPGWDVYEQVLDEYVSSYLGDILE